MSGWTVETLDAMVTAEIEALPADIRARLRRWRILFNCTGLRLSASHTSSISRASYGKSERAAETE